MDRSDALKDHRRLRTRDLDQEDLKAHQQVLQELKEQFCEYGKHIVLSYCPHKILIDAYAAAIVSATKVIQSQKRSTEAEYQRVRDYLDNERPLLESDEAMFYEKDDFITLRPSNEEPWMNKKIKRLLTWFRSRYRQQNTGHIHYFTRSRIDTTVTVILIGLILSLVSIPSLLLYFLAKHGIASQRSETLRIGTILIFTLIFSAILSLMTCARRHEILAAAAS